MTVHLDGNIIRLSGRCLAEDAELLLTALREGPECVVDVDGVEKLHLAVVQILLATGRPVRGTPDNPVIAHHLSTLLP
ncbi:hypothetical protein ACFB49_33670 [Sphingomonas sp. DBB INV C78]|uniref:STAS domain-containing protein n=1 Tax=Sphingomonas sp. DBB INV C78 TaxID=3349434 RepID=UPI0036D3F272